MQHWIDDNFGLVFAIGFPVFFATMWICVAQIVAFLGGWRLLAQRFRAPGDFNGQKWRMERASMRFGCHYNNILTVGADQFGLFVATFILFRPGHPALFVPWTEISVERKTQLFFFKVVELRLGRSENVPFAIRESLAAKLEAAAGSGWPTGYAHALETPPKPIE